MMPLDTHSRARSFVFSGVLALIVAPATLAVGCGGDVTRSVGELGRLEYSLFTDYEVPQGELTSARIVAGHTQTINVELTEEGRAETDRGGRITHRVTPSEGTDVDDRGGSTENPPSLEIRVTESGEYTIESMLDEELFDRITLHFELPAGFDMLLHTREPYSQDFDPVFDTSQAITVVEGTHVTIDTAPLDAEGQRLAGVVETEVIIDPQWMAVPGVGVRESYENGVWYSTGQANIYFIEPGQASVHVFDPVSGASGSATFNVTPIPKD